MCEYSVDDWHSRDDNEGSDDDFSSSSQSSSSSDDGKSDYSDGEEKENFPTLLNNLSDPTIQSIGYNTYQFGNETEIHKKKDIVARNQKNEIKESSGENLLTFGSILTCINKNCCKHNCLQRVSFVDGRILAQHSLHCL